MMKKPIKGLRIPLEVEDFNDVNELHKLVHAQVMHLRNLWLDASTEKEQELVERIERGERIKDAEVKKYFADAKRMGFYYFKVQPKYGAYLRGLEQLKSLQKAIDALNYEDTSDFTEEDYGLHWSQNHNVYYADYE